MLFGISVLAGLATTVAAWFVLPERVPLHFGAGGEADRWGSRTEYVVTTGAITGGLALLLWVMTVVVPRAPESLLNIPGRDKQWWLATPERREELNRRVVTDLYGIGAATLALVISIEGLIMMQANQFEPALGPWFLVLVSLYLVGVLGYTGYMIAVRYRRPRGH